MGSDYWQGYEDAQASFQTAIAERDKQLAELKAKYESLVSECADYAVQKLATQRELVRLLHRIDGIAEASGSLEAEVMAWATEAYDAAPAVPLSGDQIAEIVEYVTGASPGHEVDRDISVGEPG